MTITTVPYRNSAAYHAAEYLHREGPKGEVELFVAVGFGKTHALRREKLQHAINQGWLCRLPGYLIGLTDFARSQFDEAPSAPMGQIAAARIVNLMNRSAYVPPKRYVRDDVPAFSVRPKN